MPLILFSKLFQNRDLKGLIDLAHAHKLDGYDLCVRPGYLVNPDNAARMLPEVVAEMKRGGLSAPRATGNFALLKTSHPTAEPILSAMDKANVRLLKLGYFHLDPDQDYWQLVDHVRKALDGWEKMAERFRVRVCYHTHSNRCMGLNCASMMHLLQGFDPRLIGAYIDPAHMVVDGEEFAVGLAMVKEYLSIVALKDVLPVREEKNGHGSRKNLWVRAGEGVVDWTEVFANLSAVGFSGPMSVHCEFEVPPDQFEDALRREVAFFRKFAK
jgi:sugar phosphate isomerase/epimerase